MWFPSTWGGARGVSVLVCAPLVDRSWEWLLSPHCSSRPVKSEAHITSAVRKNVNFAANVAFIQRKLNKSLHTLFKIFRTGAKYN